MTYEQEYRDELENAHRQQTATKLFDGIRRLYSSESSPRRWIWELLQNAKDVAHNQVKVEIILNQDYLEFKHNGKPFLMKNITYLIEQVSTKDRNSNKPTENQSDSNKVRTTGKFGTGFMTTHLLSKVVQLSSIFEDPKCKIYKRFNLNLDRSAATIEEMIEAVKKASDIRRHLDDKNICPTLPPDYQLYQTCDTSFRYRLNKEGFKVAQKGIEDLHNAIIYTLVFIPELESVIVKDETKSTKTSYYIQNREKLEEITISHIEKHVDDQIEKIIIANCSKTINLADEQGEISIAIQLEQINNQYSVVKLNSSAPLLFCDFPLIGSETKFKYPVVINSPLLEPTEPRDSILLDDRNETGGKKNRAIFEETISLYGILLDYAAQNWLNPHLLALAELPKNIDSEWYESHIQSFIRAKVLESKIVRTNEGVNIKLKDALIPEYNNKNLLEFWEITAFLHSSKLPQRQDIKEWSEVIGLDNRYPKELRYNLQRLLAEISEQKTLENLSARLGLRDTNTLTWLNRVISFIIESKQLELLDNKYAILPNQYGVFQLRTQLRLDENIPDGLKEVLFILGEDWKQELLHLNVNSKLERSYSTRNISERIGAIFTEKAHPNLRDAAYLLASYLPNSESNKKAIKTDFLEKRIQIWQFAKALDNNVPEIKKLFDWTPSLWDINDEWLLNTLIQDIAQYQDVITLHTNLGKTTELESINWLSSFINFLKANKKQSLYSEIAIFPNQQGVFRKKAELLFDKNVPEQLKDVLERLNASCRSRLLHRNILNFDKSLEQYRVANNSKEINDIIRGKGRDQSEDFKRAIYNLISYFQFGSREVNRLKIWQFARDIYNQAIPDKVEIDNLEEFDWEECNKWIIIAIVEEVAQASRLTTLASFLSQTKELTTSWLNNFLCFVNTIDYTLFDKYAILPTQNEDFKLKKSLKRDGGIPEELKEIARYLRLQDWNDFLLLKNDSFTKARQIIDVKEIVTLEDIANEIDNAIRDYEGDKEDNNFRQVVQQLLHWSNSIVEKKFEKLFTYFFQRRAELVLQTLGNDEVRNNIFDVLQAPPDKLDAIANIARKPYITANDLNQLAEKIDTYKALENLKGESNVETEIVVSLLAELGINCVLPVTNQGVIYINDNSTSLIENPEDYSLVEEPDNYSVTENLVTNSLISIPNQNDDSPSSGENAERYGQIGELWARRLYEEFLEYTILARDGSGFDLLYSQEGAENIRVEAKAITYHKHYIHVTKNEWQKMVNYGDNYELLIISHNQGTPQ
ncbi:hypothetical protein DSM106972_056140 [Dulcicalothrix desertica PCC 7102]|uniref:Protein NO VEIN C-terminal domain-containing protein n=1 Tax=Dulcicalothrix desertica PCC 7102 TaxID=232991 RepID=A0A433V9D0_9CYAN|nr:DUF3883 domain-containing protein [Dulcicalothrix desertica]RUT02694.1 hypothetical protein DSM106972_056140 [Dulcicalothrix desertica PCC 7102]TWH39072.1 uncharacterized protein DUF3883 [Dulcicalothrix desertica PCC 7102]